MSRFWIRRVWRISWQVLVIAALTAGLTEIAFRLVHKINPIFVFPDASYNRFRSHPGVNILGSPINSRGFRGPEFEDRKQEGVYRILAVGDSFVHAVVPYEHHFLPLLEKDLRDDHYPVEVVNMGIPAIGVRLYHALIVNEGMALDPDLILVFFFLGNDFDLLRPKSETRKSYLLAFLKYLFQIVPEWEGRDRPKQGYDDAARVMKEERHHALLIKRTRLWFRRNSWQLQVGMRNATDYLAKIQRICDHRDVRFLVVIIPDEIQVDLELRRAMFQAYPEVLRARMDFTLPNRRFRKKLQELGIDYYDMLPVFREAARTETIFKPGDTHWNIRGNQLVAEALYEMLSGQAWLPREEGAATGGSPGREAPGDPLRPARPWPSGAMRRSPGR